MHSLLLLILCLFALGYEASAGNVAFEASSSVQSLVPSILSAASQVIQKNASDTVGASYLTGIGLTTYDSIYINWPVRHLQAN
jgi:hypothetical protein